MQRLNGGTIEIQDYFILKRIHVSIHEFVERYVYLDTLCASMVKEKVPDVIVLKSSEKCGGIRFIFMI
jgi:hypothetical protein